MSWWSMDGCYAVLESIVIDVAWDRKSEWQDRGKFRWDLGLENLAGRCVQGTGKIAVE